MEHAPRYQWASQFESSRRIIALVLAIVSVNLVIAWAAYLLYWAFIEGHASSETGLTRLEELIVLVVVLVPSLAAAIGLLGTLRLTDRAAVLRWTSAITLCVFVISPGLLGAGYVPGAVLMLLSAVLAAERRKVIA